MRFLWRAFLFFKPDWPRSLIAFAILALSTLVGLLKPWPLALVVDCVLGEQPFPPSVRVYLSGIPASSLLAILVSSIVILHVGHAIVTGVLSGMVIQIGIRGLGRVRGAVFDWLLQLSLRRLLGLKAGEVTYRATWDTFAFQTIWNQGLFTGIAATGNLAAMTVVMWRLNPRLTLAALAIVPPLLLVMQSFGRRMSRRAAEAQDVDSGIATTVQQAVANLLLIQSFTHEPIDSRGFLAQLERAYRARWSQHRTEVVYLATIATVFALGTASIVWMGALQVIGNRLSIGELWVFLAYLTQLYEPLNQLSNLGSTLSNARSGVRRVYELLDETEASAVGTVEHLTSTPPDLSFDNVSFSYNGDQNVLRSISFRIGSGESVAIIGPSGAGKTTLLHLVPRFLDPSSGRITLGGVDLRDYQRDFLRRNISMVFQESLLLPMTIAENISYGRPNASRAEITAAAIAANAHDFILRLPQGYDTAVGEGSTRLSVGEKQRINLARAFLKDAPILLLDEPTSALDAASETEVMSGLRQLMKGRTTIMVAHRLSTIRSVDRILEFRDGSLIDVGAPSKVLGEDGRYLRHRIE
jgi:ABC-type multidrug transport system fused ATPase/permease subunit